MTGSKMFLKCVLQQTEAQQWKKKSFIRFCPLPISHILSD